MKRAIESPLAIAFMNMLASIEWDETDGLITSANVLGEKLYEFFLGRGMSVVDARKLAVDFMQEMY